MIQNNETINKMKEFKEKLIKVLNKFPNFPMDEIVAFILPNKKEFELFKQSKISYNCSKTNFTLCMRNK